MQFEEQTTQSILATRAQEDTFFQHLSDSQAAFNTQVNQTIKKQMDRYMTGHWTFGENVTDDKPCERSLSEGK
jgi:hypothetical protein